MKRPSAPIALLCVAAFLLPIWGGQVPTDRLGLAPGAVWQALAGGFETPLLTHALLGSILAVAAGLALWRRRILQIPGAWITLPLVALAASVLASVFNSSFRSQSIPAALEWLVYCLAAFTTTMALGRRDGPRLFLASLVAGSTVAALIAILEYNGQRVADPGYRAFGGWVNPNALAGVLTIGILCALGLCAASERMSGGLAGIAVAVQCLALWLTGSRAGFLAALSGILVFLVLTAIWRLGVKPAAKAAGALIAGGFLVGLLILSNRSHQAADPSSSVGVSRAVSAVGAGDQSAEFRRLLYRGAAELAKERPLGYGIGSYRYYSAKPGLTTQTQYTHNSFLQLLVEGGPVTLVPLLIALGAWAWMMLRGAKTLLPTQNALRAGVVAAASAASAHGLFESNLYYFGLGAIFFSLLGVGLLIAGDGVTPEFMTKQVRLVGVVLAAAIVLCLGYFGVGEMLRAEARYAVQQGDIAEATSRAKAAASMIPADADAFGILARVTALPDSLEYAKQAAESGPSTSALRRLAELQARTGDSAGAVATLTKALELDPNNLLTLRQMMQTEIDAPDLEGARSTAEAMLRVEETPYYKVRSLPELIPTETFEARAFLASAEPDVHRKAALLRSALEGYLRYATTTVPPVLRMGEQGYGDETLAKAQKKIATAQLLASQLQELYGSTKDAAGLAWLGEADRALADAAVRLNK